MRFLAAIIISWLVLCCATLAQIPNYGSGVPNTSPISLGILNAVYVTGGCTGSGDDTTNIQNTINSNPGSFIVITGGCRISSTITINSNFTVLGSFVDGQTGHDIGNNCATGTGPRLTWIGSAGGTMVQISPITGAGNQALVGSGIVGIGLCGVGLAGIGLQVLSIRQGTFSNIYEEEMTIAGYDLATIQSGTLGESTDTQNNIFSNMMGRQIGNAAPIFRWRGSPTVSGNLSFNTFINIGGQYKNAPGIYCTNADNNRVIGTHFTRAGGGTAFALIDGNDAQGYCRNNTFYNPGFDAGGSVFRGGEIITVGGTVTQNDVVTLNFTSSLSGFPTTAAYTVQNGDTTSLVATGLKNAINANTTLSGDGFVATSSGAVVTITPNNTVHGEVTIAYTQGVNTETIAFSPSDGVMAGFPAIFEQIIGTDTTNADPNPVVAAGSQVFWLEGQGTTHFGRHVQASHASTTTNATTAASRAAATGVNYLDYFFDGGQNGVWFDDGSAKQRFIWDSSHNLLFQRQTSNAAGVSVPNAYTTTADQVTASTSDVSCFSSTGIGTQNTSTNGLIVGSVFEIKCKGNYTTPAANAATLTPKIKWGATTIATGTAVTMPASATTDPIWIDLACTVRTLGASGSVVCNGGMYYVSALTGSVSYDDMSTTTPQTVSTTASNKLDATLIWSSVAGGQTATFNQATLTLH